MLFDTEGSEMEREDAAVAALVLLHRRRQERAADNGHGSEYQRLVAHFQRRGERLRGERLVTREFVERLLGANSQLRSTERQRELEIRGPAGSVAAGRLRVRNEAPSDAAFELTIGDLVSGTRAPELSLAPARGLLRPGETCWLRLQAALETFAPGESAVLPLHCRWDTGLDRIWLVIRADGVGGPVR